MSVLGQILNTAHPVNLAVVPGNVKYGMRPFWNPFQFSEDSPRVPLIDSDLRTLVCQLDWIRDVLMRHGLFPSKHPKSGKPFFFLKVAG